MLGTDKVRKETVAVRPAGGWIVTLQDVSALRSAVLSKDAASCFFRLTGQPGWALPFQERGMRSAAGGVPVLSDKFPIPVTQTC
ncbi:MAG TPA: hypothetical protein VNK04_18010 [Gemmataceae bacterium]|jgi:hypothetical protein|nr:hypothetical protein [Gemmataceae bacterium]